MSVRALSYLGSDLTTNEASFARLCASIREWLKPVVLVPEINREGTESGKVFSGGQSADELIKHK
jgi:hypothetical protein